MRPVPRATDGSFVADPAYHRGMEPREIWVIPVGRHWIVRFDGEDVEIQGGKTHATARAFSIAQLGEGPQDVVILGPDGSIEERRSFRPRG